MPEAGKVVQTTFKKDLERPKNGFLQIIHHKQPWHNPFASYWRCKK